jgi:hypothetical protein
VSLVSRISITSGEISVEAELNNTETAKRIIEALPIEGSAQIWGDEIYFDIPISVEAETDARADVEIGTVAYWPPGTALCLFFGPTPMSDGDQPRAASPVNVVGEISDDLEPLRQVRAGDHVVVAAT